MARIIEFHVPAKFKRKETHAPLCQRGKVIDFCVVAKKSA
jgi:hypothetical protein